MAGRLRGHRIVTSWHDYPAAILGRTEGPLLDWFEKHVLPTETWVDIGAHYGYTAIALSRLVGTQGRVFAFEPMLQTCACLERTRGLNGLMQLTVIPFGLGAPDVLDMKRIPAVRGMVDSTLPKGGGQSGAVFVTRLDWVWDRICGESRRIDGVKIDVQGMEIEVVQGMRGLLEEFHPKVVIELHRGVNRECLLELLGSLGYSRVGVPLEVSAESGERYDDDRSYYFPLA